MSAAFDLGKIPSTSSKVPAETPKADTSKSHQPLATVIVETGTALGYEGKRNEVVQSSHSRTDQLTNLGFIPTEEADTFTLPDGVVAFQTSDKTAQRSLGSFLAKIGVKSRLIFKAGDQQQRFYRVNAPGLAVSLAARVPDDVRLINPLEEIVLSGSREWDPSEPEINSLTELSELTTSAILSAAVNAAGLPVTGITPLQKHSLLGQSAAFREQAIEATPLLGDLCLNGQVTVWYAAPNAGKTLIALNLLIEAVKAGRIDGANAYYVNADDGSEGLATKMELMDDIGVHTLAPGFRDFKANDLVLRLLQMAERNEARGVFVLVDTTKKFTSLMDKKLASAYGNACRQVAMRGGAVLNLAHVNKAPKADGTPQFAGTTDLVEDCDAAYTMVPLDLSANPGERIVEFRCFKRRGNNASSAAYGYAAEEGVGYVERLASVRPVDLDTLDEFKRIEVQRSDEEVIAIIAACIADGHNTKMVLGKEAAARAGIAGREAYRIVDRYTGSDPNRHRWQFKMGEHGAKVFGMLPPPPG